MSLKLVVAAIACCAFLTMAGQVMSSPFGNRLDDPSLDDPSLGGTIDVSQSETGSGEAIPDTLVVIGRLLSVPTDPERCGDSLVAADVEYEIVGMESGELDSNRIWVVQVCPDLPRALYSADAGNLGAFRVGDLHRLVLTRDLPDLAVANQEGSEGPERFWAQRTELVLRADYEPPEALGVRCLPVVAPLCGCVYGCGEGTRQADGTYLVRHEGWDQPVVARVDLWCVEQQCAEAFLGEIACDITCPSRPADGTCTCPDRDMKEP